MQYGGMGSAIANEIVNGFYFEGKLQNYHRQYYNMGEGQNFEQ